MSAAKRNEKTRFDSDEEENGALQGKAERALGALKGLFARRRDEEDYDYDDYEEYDDYGDDYDDDPGTIGYTLPAASVEEEYLPEEDWDEGEEEDILFDEDYAYGAEDYDWPDGEQTEEEAFAALSAVAGGAYGYAEEAPEAEEDYAGYEEEDAGEYETEDGWDSDSYYGEEYELPEEEYEDGAAYDTVLPAAEDGEDWYGEETGEVPAESYADSYDDDGEEYYEDESYGDYYAEGSDDGYYDGYEEPAAGTYDSVDSALRSGENETAKEDYFREFENWDNYEDVPEESFLDRMAEMLRPVLIPALGVAAALALGVIVFACTTLWGGKGRDRNQNSEPGQFSTLPPTSAELQATGQMPPESEQPAPAPAVRAVRSAEGALIPAGTTAVVPLRSTTLGMDAFAGGTHIGNSFVEGMMLWSEIDTQYVCADGVSLDNMIGNYLYYVTVRNYDSIYLTLGINEIGWPVDSFISKYEKVIDYIRSDSTDKTKAATIYITSVFPTEEIMETQAGESGSPIHKDTILQFNEALKEMCLRKGCWYLDVYSELAGPDGYLPEEVAADDHVHFEKTGYRIWTEYLCNHYIDDSFIG